MISEIDIYHQLGKRITYLRKKKGLSSLQLAINADINKNYLNDLENGRRNPSLDIDLSELFIGIRDYSLSNDYNKIK